MEMKFSFKILKDKKILCIYKHEDSQIEVL